MPHDLIVACGASCHGLNSLQASGVSCMHTDEACASASHINSFAQLCGMNMHLCSEDHHRTVPCAGESAECGAQLGHHAAGSTGAHLHGRRHALILLGHRALQCCASLLRPPPQHRVHGPGGAVPAGVPARQRLPHVCQQCLHMHVPCP